MQHNGFLIVIIIFFCLDSSLGKSPSPKRQNLTISSITEDSLDVHESARLEVGLGYGIAGEGDGLSGRLAFSLLTHKWGGLVRLTAFDGGEGSVSNWFGPPVEKFYDKAILLSRVMSKNENSTQTIVSAGIGWINGSRLTAQGDDLEDFGPKPGFAFEIGVAPTKSIVGWKLGLMGNVNTESNLYGLFLSITLGHQK